MKKGDLVIVVVLCITLLLGGAGGFALGRATAPARGGDLTQETELSVEDASDSGAGSESRDSNEIAQAAEESAPEASKAALEEAPESDSKDAETTAAEESEEPAEEETEQAEEAAEQQESEAAVTAGLIDAADEEYYFPHHDDAEEFNFEVGEHADVEEKTVDPVFLANPSLREAELPDGVASTLYGKNHDDCQMQIVILGDSQFGNFLGYDGMAYMLSQKLKANVYNLAVGGTSISLEPNGRRDSEGWDSSCGVGMAKIICGEVSGEFLTYNHMYQYNVLKSCDFSKTDLFILEYGVNDFFQKAPTYVQDDASNIKTVAGGLEEAIVLLRVYYPDAAIMVCTPGYTQFFEAGTGAYIGDVNTLNNGVNTLQRYIQTISNIASTHTATSVMNAYEEVNINGYNAKEMLMDGIHMTVEGRKRYVSVLSHKILLSLGYSLPEGVDPDDIDWVSQKQE